MSERELIRELHRYLSESITSNELKDWVFEHLQDVLETGDSDLVRRMDEANVLLMELSDNFIDEEEFMRSIDGIVRDSETLIQKWDPSMENNWDSPSMEDNKDNIGVTIEKRAVLNRQVFDLLLSQNFGFEQ